MFKFLYQYKTNLLEKNLLNNEEIKFKGEINNIIFFPSIFSFFLMLITFFIGDSLKILSLAFAIHFVYSFINMYVYKISTEMLITDKRILKKTGLLNVKTSEINLNKIESVFIEENLIGKLLHYSDLIIKGTGGTGITFYYLINGEKAKKTIMNQIHLDS